MTPTRIPAVRALVTVSTVRGSGRKSASSPWIRPVGWTRGAERSSVRSRVGLAQLATLGIGRYEVPEAVAWQAQALTVVTQGGEEVGGNDATEVEEQAFIVGHGSMQPLTGRLVRTGQDRSGRVRRRPRAAL
jgi:hypothetical protein